MADLPNKNEFRFTNTYERHEHKQKKASRKKSTVWGVKKFRRLQYIFGQNRFKHHVVCLMSAVYSPLFKNTHKGVFGTLIRDLTTRGKPLEAKWSLPSLHATTKWLLNYYIAKTLRNLDQPNQNHFEVPNTEKEVQPTRPTVCFGMKTKSIGRKDWEWLYNPLMTLHHLPSLPLPLSNIPIQPKREITTRNIRRDLW